MVTVCPLCQFNLDSYQPDVNRMFAEDVSIPVMYFTQLVGMAMALPSGDLGLQRNITYADSWLEKEAAVGA